MIDPVLVSLGFGVGVVVGLTGVGGGALLTPLLILVVGVRPTIAVGTDLAFAALTKLVGAWGHLRLGTVDLRLTAWLAGGSVPGALLGSQLVNVWEEVDAAQADALVMRLLGLALLAAASASLLRVLRPRPPGEGRAPGPLGAASLGLGVGLMVGLTSIGAGSLLMAGFALVYALPAARAAGTDIVHGAILAVVAGAAHAVAGRVELPLLSNLVIGSLPGVLLGSWLCSRVPERPLRLTIAVLLVVSGLRLL